MRLPSPSIRRGAGGEGHYIRAAGCVTEIAASGARGRVTGEVAAEAGTEISTIMSGVDRTHIDTEKNMFDVLDRMHEINIDDVDPTHVFTLAQVCEGLLLKLGEKANEGGPFFPPREVIRVMVRVIDPQAGETVYDPGCGTGGFLAQAYANMPDRVGDDGTVEQIEALTRRSFYGRDAGAVLVRGAGQPPAGRTLRIWYYDLRDVKVGKKTPLTVGRFEQFFRRLPARADGERSWTMSRAQIEARNYDLKAVNPNAKSGEDTRTPEELLGLIEAWGREVAEAPAALRGITATHADR